MPKRAVLLVNLGSPTSTAVPDVRRYLREFLGDERVIDLKPRWAAWLLVNGIITTFRAPKSAHAYEQIWTAEGSPLIVTSKAVRKKLAANLGAETPVYLAMRYGTPSIKSVVSQMAADGIEDVLLLPQYPHYAMSSWETVVVKVYAEAAALAPKLRIECIQPFYQDPDYIEALHTVCAPYLAQPHDFVLSATTEFRSATCARRTRPRATARWCRTAARRALPFTPPATRPNVWRRPARWPRARSCRRTNSRCRSNRGWLASRGCRLSPTMSWPACRRRERSAS
jgi:hypothetical protein